MTQVHTGGVPPTYAAVKVAPKGPWLKANKPGKLDPKLKQKNSNLGILREMKFQRQLCWLMTTQ